MKIPAHINLTKSENIDVAESHTFDYDKFIITKEFYGQKDAYKCKNCSCELYRTYYWSGAEPFRLSRKLPCNEQILEDIFK